MSNCPYCGKNANLFLKGSDINRQVSTIEFRLMKCTHCGLIYIDNPPENIGEYYTNDYHQPKAIISSIDEIKLIILKSFKRKGKLLEIGSSCGSFSLIAKKSGFDVTTIEQDINCVTHMQQELQINAIQSDMPQEILKNNEEKYDAICLWHCLEHLYKPWEVLEQATSHLEYNGILLVAVPNPESFFAKILGNLWTHWDLPRHLFEFPISWMENFANKNNLDIEFVATRNFLHMNYESGSIGLLLKYLCPIKSLKPFVEKFGSKMGSFLKFKNSDKGSCYIIILRKQG